MRRVFQWTGRIALGLIFIAAAFLKLADPAAFAEEILHYRLLPYPLAAALAVYLPWLELAGGAAVLCRWRERGALLLLTGLSVIFCAALGSAWARGLNISCGCFGPSTQASNLPLAFVRAFALGAAAFSLLLATRAAPTRGR